MRKFRERNLLIIAAVTAVLLIVGAYTALNFESLTETRYSAYLQSAVGLQPGDVVTIAGVRVGSVSGLTLCPAPCPAAGTSGVAAVKATFYVQGGHRLGPDTSLDVKILNPVGVEYVELAPRGVGRLSGPIPLARTTFPGTLVGDLNQLTTEAQQTNIPQLVEALRVLTQTVAANSPAQTKAALDGVANLSAVLAARQQELEQLVGQSDRLTGLLDRHSAQLVDLLGQSGHLLSVLDRRKQAINSLLTTTSQLTYQIDHIITGDRSVLDPLLANLQTVSSYLASDAGNLQKAIPLVAAFSRYSANVTGSGPYADVVAPTLVVPDNLIAECAAMGQLDPQRGCRA